MYSASRTVIKKEHPLYKYCLDTALASKRLYNAALFRIRNNFTGRGKEAPTENESLVLKELKALKESGYNVKSSSVLSYNTLEKLMRITKNPDFFDEALSMQTAQHVLKDAVNDFNNWLKALRAYKKDPSGFLGKPKMPGYKKSDTRTTEFTNQDCRIKDGYLKLPLTDIRLRIKTPEAANLKCVKIKPYYEGFLIICTYETKDVVPVRGMPFVAGIDFGVDNIAAIATNEGSSLLFKGNIIKAQNQYFNKERARLLSCATKGAKITHTVNTHQLSLLSMHRDNFLRDQMHKISSCIINFCIEHHIGTIVMGVNKLWKQELNIGAVNNQKFIQIPFAELQFMLAYKADRAGINVVCQEESYTSAADFLSRDYIPVYGIDDKEADFSGKRIHRGLYKSGTGVLINADINGAANILRKAFPHAFDKVKDFTYMLKPATFWFNDINHKGIPDKGVVAA